MKKNKLNFCTVILLTLICSSSYATTTIPSGSCEYEGSNGKGTITWRTTAKGNLEFTDSNSQSFFHKILASSEFGNKFKIIDDDESIRPSNDFRARKHKIEYMSNWDGRLVKFYTEKISPYEGERPEGVGNASDTRDTYTIDLLSNMITYTSNFIYTGNDPDHVEHIYSEIPRNKIIYQIHSCK
ncbi:MAG TPA: hypothetical protein VKR58_15520 [Aquella sp.]|nr:hypothetical protein [Aquella sp.]